ncbi:Protein required for ethanol metabolism [Tilletia horrida]|nr:Protein required for ethanol metabolism [Tilletia horrida]
MSAAGAKSGGSFLQRFIQASQSTFPRKCASAAFLFAAGDCIAQQAIEKRGSKHDFWRTGRLAFYGGVIFSPILVQWFKVLERIQFQSRAATIGAKVAADQLIAAPNIVLLFFSSTTLMAGGSIDDVKAKVRESWWPTVKMNWLVWVPVQTVNMGFVPLNQRFLFVNVVALFWNTFLSVMSGSKGEQEEVKSEITKEVRLLEQTTERELVAIRHEGSKELEKLRARAGASGKLV